MNELIYDDLRIYLLTWQDPHVVVTSSSYDVVTTTYDVVRRRDDDARRRRTYITGFSVTFLCEFLTVFLTRCCYMANELIYDVSRIYLLTWQEPYVVVTSSSDDVVTTS